MRCDGALVDMFLSSGVVEEWITLGDKGRWDLTSGTYFVKDYGACCATKCLKLAFCCLKYDN